MRIKQASKELGVSVRTVQRALQRFAERPEVRSIRRTPGGHRIFTPEVLHGLARVMNQEGQFTARRRVAQTRRAWHRALAVQRARRAARQSARH